MNYVCSNMNVVNQRLAICFTVDRNCKTYFCTVFREHFFKQFHFIKYWPPATYPRTAVHRHIFRQVRLGVHEIFGQYIIKLWLWRSSQPRGWKKSLTFYFSSPVILVLPYYCTEEVFRECRCYFWQLLPRKFHGAHEMIVGVASRFYFRSFPHVSEI